MLGLVLGAIIAAVGIVVVRPLVVAPGVLILVASGDRYQRGPWWYGAIAGAIVAVVAIAVGSFIVTATGILIILVFGGRYLMARSRYQSGTGSQDGALDHEAAGKKEMHL